MRLPGVDRQVNPNARHENSSEWKPQRGRLLPQNLSLKKIRNFLRRIHRGMPEQETELSIVDKGENAPDGASAENAVFDGTPPEAETVPAAGSPEVAETVGRAEFDQLKAERDHLIDREARLQAEFENARQ